MKCPFCHKEFLSKEARIRSTPENNFYWGVVIEILSDELGYAKNEMHDILKSMFLHSIKYIHTKNGVKEVNVTGSTATLRVAEFEQYLEEIRMWAIMDLGIVIPTPEPNEEE